jgi:hypothetical protein
MQLEDRLVFMADHDIRVKGHRLRIDAILEPFFEGMAPRRSRRMIPNSALKKFMPRLRLLSPIRIIVTKLPITLIKRTLTTYTFLKF